VRLARFAILGMAGRAAGPWDPTKAHFEAAGRPETSPATHSHKRGTQMQARMGRLRNRNREAAVPGGSAPQAGGDLPCPLRCQQLAEADPAGR